MLGQHGWKSKPTPRRGFTVVEARRVGPASPVVAAVHDSLQGVHLFRAAADEAMSRCRHLVVLDYGERALHEELADETNDLDPRERKTLRTLLSNPHVRVIRTDPTKSDIERTVEYCESVEASLLVIGADHIGAEDLTPSLSGRIFKADLDVLVLADPGHSHPDVSDQGESGKRPTGKRPN